MVKILVHVTHGPEHPTRAVLGFHVAKAAVEEGHEVTVFLAGDAVQLMRKGAIDHLKGLGTGDMREIYNFLETKGTKFYLSGKSSEARGLTESELMDKNYEFASPKQLVQLAVMHDKMFNY